MKLLVSAGFDRSSAALVLCQTLLNSGHEICHLVIKRSVSVSNIKNKVVKNGFRSLLYHSSRYFNGGDSTFAENPLKVRMAQLGILDKSLSSWCKRNKVKFEYINDINDSSVQALVKSLEPNYMIYCGGGIVKKELLKAMPDRIINIHSGPLPDIRGMNAIEWAVLLNKRTVTSIHFIDEGIDTGKTISEIDINSRKIQDISQLRNTAILYGIDELVNLLINGLPPGYQYDASIKRNYRQCFTLAPILVDILKMRLNTRV